MKIIKTDNYKYSQLNAADRELYDKIIHSSGTIDNIKTIIEKHTRQYEICEKDGFYCIELPTYRIPEYGFLPLCKPPILENDFENAPNITPIISNHRISSNLKIAVIVFHKNIQIYPHEWIQKCIDSIKNQTINNFDVFELDYGGTNVKIYPDSIYWSMAMDNHAEAHNFLLDLVFAKEYDYAFNVNIDDFYSNDRIEKQLIYAGKGYDVISSNFIVMDIDGKLQKQMILHNFDPYAESLDNHNIIAHPVCCYSKNFWLNCTKLRGEEIPKDDFELWKRSYGKFKFVIVPEVLLYYRIYDSKVSAVGNARMVKHEIDLMISNAQKREKLPNIVLYPKKGNTPLQITPGNLIDQLSIVNIKIWMHEDKKRMTTDDKEIADATRATNVLNGQRNNLIENIDIALNEVAKGKPIKLFGQGSTKIYGK